MSREIKFRVWDKNKFLYSEKETDGFWGDVVLDDLKLCSSQQQSTGLKDKNAREIYEGDIVICNNLGYLHEGNNLILEVKYDFYFLSELEENAPEYVEVIGNIYENQELL